MANNRRNSSNKADAPPVPTVPPVSTLSTVPAAPANLAELVYTSLKQEMHDFHIIPGDRLSEAEIGMRLGVSRTPVREALSRLRNEGFVDVEAKSGWFVKALDFAKLDDLYDLRMTLELASVVRLCAGAGNGDLEKLRAVWLVPASERLSDGRQVGVLDEQFHARLVSAAGNAEVARVHWDVTERIRMVRRLDFTRSDRIAATYAEHGKILRAVMQFKADQAQLLLRAHIEQSKIEVRKITLSTLFEVRGSQRG